MIIEEFLQESGFEKREKYFDWLMRGGRGGREGTPPSCLVVLLWYFIGSEVVCFSGIIWVGSGVCRRKKKKSFVNNKGECKLRQVILVIFPHMCVVRNYSTAIPKWEGRGVCPRPNRPYSPEPKARRPFVHSFLSSVSTGLAVNSYIHIYPCREHTKHYLYHFFALRWWNSIWQVLPFSDQQ